MRVVFREPGKVEPEFIGKTHLRAHLLVDLP